MISPAVSLPSGGVTFEMIVSSYFWPVASFRVNCSSDEMSCSVEPTFLRVTSTTTNWLPLLGLKISSPGFVLNELTVTINVSPTFTWSPTLKCLLEFELLELLPLVPTAVPAFALELPQAMMTRARTPSNVHNGSSMRRDCLRDGRDVVGTGSALLLEVCFAQTQIHNS